MTAGASDVWVTGVGVLTPIGIGAQPFWSALTQGISGIRKIPGATDIPHVAAQLVDYVPRDLIRSAHLRRMDKVSRALLAAARLAVDDAQLGDAEVATERCAIVVGTAYGNLGETAQYFQRFATKGAALASPMLFPNLVLNAPASYAAMELGSTGVNLSLCSGEVSGECAILEAAELIRRGRADVVLAGGVDEFDPVLLEGYRGFGALSAQRGGVEWSSPYDAKRNGVVLGEGAAVLVLESAARARARNARAYARLVSALQFGIPSPIYDWPRTSEVAVGRLTGWLGHKRDAVGLVLGAANSSIRLDGLEIDILNRVFGEQAGQVALTSIKGAVGEFGAAGALTASAAVLAVRHAMAPPLCHLETADQTAQLKLSRQPSALGSDRVLQIGAARGGSFVALQWATEAQG